jgi:hypothetical protein
MQSAAEDGPASQAMALFVCEQFFSIPDTPCRPALQSLENAAPARQAFGDKSALAWTRDGVRGRFHAKFAE